MGRFVANINSYSGRKCCFCKNWDDKDNIAIKVRDSDYGIWECDDKLQKSCSLCNEDKLAADSCKDFECKLELKEE